MHYEWLVRKRQQGVDVAVHFEAKDQGVNLSRLDRFLERCPGLNGVLTWESLQGAWGRQYAQFAFRIPYEGTMPGPDTAKLAAETMAKLVQLTLPHLKELK